MTAQFDDLLKLVHEQNQPKAASIDWDDVADNTEAAHHLCDAYEHVVASLGVMGYDVTNDENYKGTAARAAKAACELIRSPEEIKAYVSSAIATTFPSEKMSEGSDRGMVVSGPNLAWSMCPHHLLPVLMKITVGYIPGKQVLGISKISRIVQMMAKRPVLQEDLVNAIADVFYRDLESKGAAVRISGIHLCMAARGIEASESRIYCQALRGFFKDNADTRAEFMSIADQHQVNPF